MSLLFTVEAKIVKPNIETLLMYPFTEIWERDTTIGKHHAIEDFTYIEFVASVQKSNPYSGYAEEIRRTKVREQIISVTREDWSEDELIQLGIAELIKFQKEASVTYNYYMSAKNAADKLQDFFNDLDMKELNIKTGLPLYKPKEITSALNDTSKVLENLNTLRDKVDNEIFEEIKNRAQKVISPFADPSSLNKNQ